MKISLRWLQGRTGKDKENFSQAVLTSEPLRRMKEILLEDLESLERPSEGDYDNPSWAYLQAHRNGRVQQINALLTLLEPIK